jgi:DNA-binding transcriptional MerR regulator
MTTATMLGDLTSAEVLATTGLSYRQLGWLVRNNVIKPKVDGSGPGNPWSWGDDQVRVLRLIAVLREHGASMDTLRHVVPQAERLPEALWDFRVLITTDGRIATLLGNVPAGYLVDLAMCRIDVADYPGAQGEDQRQGEDRRRLAS